MMFIKKKDFEEEVQRRIWEEQRRQEIYRRFESNEKRLAELEMQLYDLRMKTDPEFRRRNTPTCSCGEVTTCNGQ
jgi:hypothetical protein